MSLAHLKRLLKASTDPIFFVEDSYFLGLKLTPKQAVVMKEFYNLYETIIELVLVVGRRGGKTWLASVIALYEAFRLLILDDPATHYDLSPGTKIFILCIAVSEEQGKDTIFDQILQKMKRSPFFRSLRPRVFSNEIYFPNKNISILCGTSSSASMVGRSAKVVIFEELERFEQTTSKRGAWNVYHSIGRCTGDFGMQGKRISISSPMSPKGIILSLYEQTKTLDTMLGFFYPTWEFNPDKYPRDGQFLKAEFEKDPVTAARDYGCEPTSLKTRYYGNPDIIAIQENMPNLLEMIAEDIDLGNLVKPGPYVLTGDPAPKNDAFGFALTHRELSDIVVDGLWRFVMKEKEVDPLQVRDFALKVIGLLPVRYFVVDTWTYPILLEEISRKGATVQSHTVKKTDHDKVKERFYKRSLLVCNYPFVKKELEEMQTISTTKVDHPKNGSKDVADALANGVWTIENLLGKQTHPLNVIVTV